ncbi:MAG: hypothetical protein ACPLRW_07910 [Moorellales bacterium]
MAKKASLSERRAARKAYEQARKTSKPGEGKRFKALVKAVAAGGAENPEAVAAAIGRRKYGKKRFQQMAAKGRKKKG